MATDNDTKKDDVTDETTKETTEPTVEPTPSDDTATDEDSGAKNLIDRVMAGESAEQVVASLFE